MRRTNVTVATTDQALPKHATWSVALLGLAVLLYLALSGAAMAQGNGSGGETGAVAPSEIVQGTQIILPDGSRCLPLPAAERDSVAGATLDYYCGDGVPRGLVGGVLESDGQVSLEVVDLSGRETGDTGTQTSQLALFDVQRLVLEDGGVCLPTQESSLEGDSRPVTYECDVDGERLLAVGTLASRADDDHPTSYVTLAPVNEEGAAAGQERSVAVSVLDGALPLTKTEWVLSSWGTGQAPPLAGSAPTLSFQDGMVVGNTGCNSYFAPAVILTPGQLELGVAGSTLMACSEEIMTQETRFMAALDGVIGYERIWDDLYLYGGAEVIRFSPAGE